MNLNEQAQQKQKQKRRVVGGKVIINQGMLPEAGKTFLCASRSLWTSAVGLSLVLLYHLKC